MKPRGQSARPLARFVQAGLVLPAVLLLGACESDALAPEAFSPAPCALPTDALSAIQTGPVDAESMRLALLHAAGPMAASLAPGEETSRLRTAVTEVANAFGSRSDTECRMLTLAWDAVDALPPDPATAPERDGIRMILALATTALLGTGSR